MDTFEKYYIEKGYNAIVGIDEVGRGPLAGPVCAAALVLPWNKIEELKSCIKDSKKLSPSVRDELSVIIHKAALGIAIVTIDHETIDRINILNATKLAMKKAVEKLSDAITPNILLIDGNFFIDSKIEQKPIVKGDSKSVSIAAASIVAKVYRDKLMMEFSESYPQYGFEKHKGYGTPEHCAAIKQFGPSPIHRKTFAKVKEHVL